MSNCILFIFEGAVTEKTAWNSLNRYFLCDEHAPIIYGIYGGEIYSLFHKMKADPDLDLFTLLKNNDKNKVLLEDVYKDQVSEIYLFFDYDGHASAASDAKLLQMLEFFNEETENGKLYLSYPMIESLKHLNLTTPFESVLVECKKNINYKNFVHVNSEAQYRDIAAYSQVQWVHVISEHCKKLNSLMKDVFSFPENYFDQTSVFNQQVIKHINPNSKVAALSAFPVFLLDYYGCVQLYTMLSSNN